MQRCIGLVGLSTPPSAPTERRGAELGAYGARCAGCLRLGETEAAGGFMAASALAGVLTDQFDPALLLNGQVLYGVTGVSAVYEDMQIDALVTGGVTALECWGGKVSVMRGIRRGRKPARRRMRRSASWDDSDCGRCGSGYPKKPAGKVHTGENNAGRETPSGSQVIVELEDRIEREIIEGRDNLTVTALNPTRRRVWWSLSLRLCMAEPDFPDGSYQCLRRKSMAIRKIPTTADTYLEVDGVRVAVVQSYRRRAGEQGHLRVRPAGTGDDDSRAEPVYAGADADLRDGRGDSRRAELCGYGEEVFTVICKPHRNVIYTGCQWKSLQESAEVGGNVLEKGDGRGRPPGGKPVMRNEAFLRLFAGSGRRALRTGWSCAWFRRLRPCRRAERRWTRAGMMCRRLGSDERVPSGAGDLPGRRAGVLPAARLFDAGGFRRADRAVGRKIMRRSAEENPAQRGKNAQKAMQALSQE